MVDAAAPAGRGAASAARSSSLEIALSLVLLVGASLFVRSFLNLQDARAGIDTAPLMTLRFYMPGDLYEPRDAMIRRVDDIVRRVEALPGVVSAMASNMVPLGSGGSGGAVVPEGVAFAEGQEPNVSYFGVTPHLLKTLNVPLVAGRDFTDAEGQGRSAVAIVNGVFAKRLWPNRTDVVGQRFRRLEDKQPSGSRSLAWSATSVCSRSGTASRRRTRSSRIPYEPTRNTGLTIRVAGGSPAGITSGGSPGNPQIGSDAAALQHPDRRRSAVQHVLAVPACSGGCSGSSAPWRCCSPSIGVYGVLSYAVSQRTQEIGVRMALGASRQNVFALVVSHGARLAAAGIVCGVMGAFGVTRVVTSLLYNVTRDRSAQLRRAPPCSSRSSRSSPATSPRAARRASTR